MGIKLLGFARKLVADHALDALFLAGSAVFVYGFWLAWRPLGFIVAGFIVAGFSFFLGYGRPRGDAQ